MIRNKHIGLCIIITLLLLPSISAIGIIPAGQLFEYEPGKIHTVELAIQNNDHRNMKVSVYAQGNLSDAITIEDRILTFAADEPEKKTKATFTIPGNLDPGTQVVNIVILEVPGESTSKEGNTITATGSVISQLRVNVPYPGLYAKAAMHASTSKADEPVGITISVYNAGEQDIKEAYADVNIFGPTNEKIASFKTDKKGILSKQEEKIVGTWEGPKYAGKYFARATIHYDGKELLVEKVFEVGDKNVVITDIDVQSYKLGAIARVIMAIDNNWNQELLEIYAQADIIDKRGSIVSTFKTVTSSIKAFSSATLEGFWDTKGLDQGEYDLKVTLYYDEGESTTVHPIYLTFDEIRFLEQPGTGMVIGGEEKKESNVMLLTVLVVLLIIFNVGLFMYFRKSLKKKK